MADYSSLSITELKKVLKQKKKLLRKNYREKLIRDIRKIDKVNQKITKGENNKKKSKPKSFDEYFQECIKNKKIPPDTPPYFRKALRRAMKEYEQGIVKERSALKDFAGDYVINGEPGIFPLEFFQNKKSIIKSFIKNHRNTIVTIVLECMMEKNQVENKKTVDIQDKSFFSSGKLTNLRSTNAKELITKAINRIMENISSYQRSGSGWYFKEIIKLLIKTVKYDPLGGSSYIPLPDWIMRKKAIVSIRNKDDKCFLWSILRYLHPREINDSRLTDLKQYEHEIKIPKGFVFPVKIKDIAKFENANPNLPGINVFSINSNKKFYTLRLALKDPQNSIDLFLYEEDGKCHYSLIKNFSRLLRSQITKRTDEPIHICKRCLNGFTKERLLQRHIFYCKKNGAVFIVMPKPGKTLFKFRNHSNKFLNPFVVYADFECFTKPITTPKFNPEEPYNYNYQKHTPSGFCFYIKGISGKRMKPIVYTIKEEGEDIAKIFVEKIAEATRVIYNDFYRRPKPLIISQDEKILFEEAKICHICETELLKDKVRDHCHFTGQYRGAAHNKCNLNCRKPRVLPVIFHNLQGYDAHLFIKQLGSLQGELSCIPSTEEKYISFSKKIKVGEYRSKKGEMVPIYFEIRFIDSYKFQQTSLEKLVKNQEFKDLVNLKREFKQHSELFKRKGVYPYDYVSSLDKLSETQLPPKEEFYSKLKNEHISEEDYNHAIRVWDEFNCKTIRDYHDLYLKSDVMLLADVFENFRKTCMKHYNLDPAHYYTTPGLAWDACLKETKQEIHLLEDYDMLMMFERGIRGGVSHISKRYAEANNPYMKSYDPEKSTKYIQYLDANNLYGWAMSQNLPTHGFKWMKNITKDKVMEILEKANHSMSNHGKTGYIFEVDLEYPEKLWKTHNDYPLAPEKIEVNKVEKLISHFKPRKNYVIHYRALRQCLEMGLKLKAVHKGISFKQKSWMAPYIDKNTKLRMEAKIGFEKDFFKLMNNSVFGKTIENIRKRQNIKLVDNRKKAFKLTKQPNFESAVIFDENLIAVHMQKTEVYFNKPVYTGQAVLDLSKTLMFDFHYNYIKPKYGNKAELLFTDTDSLMYEIRTKDFYKDIAPDIEAKFDTSDYPKEHPSGILTGVNKKVIGMFKDEAAGKQITHFIGLRPKLYSYKVEEEKETKKCKGITKTVIEKEIKFENYYNCLFTGEKEMRSMKVIQSDKHDIFSKEVNKIALSRDDDKRIVLDDQIHTLAIR